MPYIDVHDRGSDLTVVSLAGPLGRVAGMPYGFEFKSLTKRTEFNLVFLRDVHKAFYQSTPDGKPGGLDFFADTISDAVASLGASYNVALGCSMGGSAAIYFGARCKLSQVIAFSPIFPLAELGSPRSWIRQLFNFGSLLSSPGGYATNVSLACVARKLYLRAAPYLDERGIPSYTERTSKAADVPNITIYYGERCAVDRRHSQVLADCPAVEQIPCRRGSITRAAT